LPPADLGTCRAGAFCELMKDVVVKLQEEDMVAIAAYLATQAP
jgi:cytochrome c553